MGKDASRGASPWPRYNWILIALQLLSAAVVLVCLGWYGLKDRSGLPSDFMCWLPGVAAGFTLLYAVLSLSSSSSNLSVHEVLIGDAISLGLWIAVVCRMALLVAGTGTFGRCAVLPEGSGSGRNSCAASQIVLALAVDLSVLSLTRMIIALFVRRRAPAPSRHLDDDCEKLYDASE
ncbi:unnamed protein product [Tuber aestivum]|uniref:MARVEL domain-containing protein n=1 Tax=Tuber aestivum TaxID=59557 RepID=A0A292PRM3_9PEZI|nr:unnamed protein product [Tuber aestivum]